MENVVFIDPSHKGSTEEFNCGLLTIGTYLDSKGHNVNLIFSSNDFSIFDQYINDETIYVGISAMTTQIPEAMKVLKYVKEKWPKVKIVFGGYHSILYPKQTLEHKDIDFICLGDGVELSEELILAFKGKKNFSEIQGLGYKENGELKFNEKCPHTDLSIIPRMNYNLVHDFKIIERKLHFNKGEKVKTGIVFSGNGCPFSCTFCINSAMQRK